MSLWGALFGGCNFVLHAAGWLESGLTTSYEKFILDIEMLQMFAEVFQPVGAGALRHRARGGCRSRRRRALLRLRPYHGALSKCFFMRRWSRTGAMPAAGRDDGAKTATERATGIWQNELKRYVAPPRDPAIVEALDTYVERRKAEGRRTSHHMRMSHPGTPPSRFHKSNGGLGTYHST